LIIHNDSTEEQQDQMLRSIGEIIAQHKGSVLKTEKWGKRNFKYVIKKQSKGHYCFLVFEAPVSVLKEIERSIMYNEAILRYNFIRLETFVETPAEPVFIETQGEPETEKKAGTPAETDSVTVAESVAGEQSAATEE
jgi:small subunit ribosomal protein S6